VVPQSPSLFLPFIFEHRVGNLAEATKEQLTEYWKREDVRVVEELVVAGCEAGEEMALSRGWVRALRKMVVNGMEIHFPLIKLTSFVVSEKRGLEELSNEPTSAEVHQTAPLSVRGLENQPTSYQTALSSIKGHCLQMVEYSLLALSEFLVSEEIEQLSELREFLYALLRPEVINNCFAFIPDEAVKVIYCLFSEGRVALIDQLES
jgi:hypothetical protein